MEAEDRLGGLSGLIKPSLGVIEKMSSTTSLGSSISLLEAQTATDWRGKMAVSSPFWLGHSS